VEAEALLQIHPCFFSHSSIKQCVLPLSALTVSDVWGQQSHAEKRINYRNLKWTFDDSLPCYCYTTKRNSRTMLSQVSQRKSAGKWVEMSELQADHCITPEQWSWLLCSVSATPVNKVLLQELNWFESRCWLQIF